MVFIETTTFSNHREKYLGDDEFRRLQISLAVMPTAGDVIRGSGGARKLRWKLYGQGKRGGLRIIYTYFPEEQQIHLLTLYAKNEATDLTQNQLATIRTIIQSIRHELKAQHRSRNH